MPIPPAHRSPLLLAIPAALLLALLVAGWRYASATPATGVVTVDEVTFDDDGQKHLLVHARVTNGTSQPIFVYDTYPRGYDFDDATGTLVVTMHTVPTPPTGSSADCHVNVPHYREIGPRRTETLTVKAPRQFQRFQKGGPLIASPVATHVRFELGWSDQPIKLAKGQESLCTFDAYTVLQGIERGIAVQTSR